VVAVAVAYFNILAIAVLTSPYRGNNRYRVEEQLVTASGTATVRWGKRKIMLYSRARLPSGENLKVVLS
jgi:hypothetical protein